MSFEPGHAALLATAICFFFIGHIYLCLGRPQRARSAAEWILTALMVGAIWSIVIAIGAVVAFGPLDVWVGRMVIAGPALAGALGMAFAPSMRLSHVLNAHGDGLPFPKATTRLDRYSRLLLIAFGAGVIFTASASPVHLFDSVFHFGYKGRVMFTEGIGGAAWTDLDGVLGRIMTHPKYPPGVSAMEVVPSWFLGHFDASAARGLLSIFALAPAIWIFAALRSRGRLAATFGALTWLTVPLLFYLHLPLGQTLHSIYGLGLGSGLSEDIYTKLVFESSRDPELTARNLRNMFLSVWKSPDGGGMDGSADLPLAACLFGALVHLWRVLPGNSVESDRTDWTIGTLMLAGMLLMKNEGGAYLILMGIALLSAVTITARGNLGPTLRIMIPRLGAVFTIAIVLASPWFLVRGSIPEVDENYPAQLTLENVVSVVSEPLEGLESEGADGYAPVIVAKRFIAALANPLKWNLLWVTFTATLAWCVICARKRLVGDALLPVLIVLLGSGTYFTILVVAPWDYEALFRMGIPERLFIHIASPAVLATFVMLWHAPDELS